MKLIFSLFDLLLLTNVVVLIYFTIAINIWWFLLILLGQIVSGAIASVELERYKERQNAKPRKGVK